jgi:hypothetical protein
MKLPKPTSKQEAREIAKNHVDVKPIRYLTKN